MQWAFPFAKPVDINLFKDYPNIIAKPMDFATIKANMEGGRYKEPQQFYDGMKLVFNNARRYNPPGSDVNLMASGVEVSTCMIRVLALCMCVPMRHPLRLIIVTSFSACLPNKRPAVAHCDIPSATCTERMQVAQCVRLLGSDIMVMVTSTFLLQEKFEERWQALLAPKLAEEQTHTRTDAAAVRKQRLDRAQVDSPQS